MEDMYSRTALLIGHEGVKRLEKSRVAVFGIGGVGSFAAEALARAGVGSLVLVDSDVVCPSNLNRQIHAMHSTLGRAKVEVMRERILDINPRAQVEAYRCFYEPALAGELIRSDYDYIVDAIDTVPSKIDLIVSAWQRNIPIISSMGAGNKLDPTRFEVADIYDTSVCPLARVMRRELKKRGVKALKVVYSREEPVVCEEEMEKGSAAEERRGKRPPGSISFVPPVAGLIMAGEVVKDLLKLTSGS